MATLREVAAEANVSQSTVSKVLNNVHDAHIPDVTKERVRTAALRVGYHPSAIARGLAGKRMNSLGLVMAYAQESVTSDPYLGACLDGVLKVSKERRQKTVLFTEDSWADALQHVPSYCDGHCDGLMLIIPRLDSKIVSVLRDRKPQVPFVLVGDSRADDQLVCVDVDNVGAARHAVEYLIGLGHRRIAALCGNDDFCSNQQRLDGYHQALKAAGISADPELILPGEYWPDAGRHNTLTLLERFAGRRANLRPTALFCFNDNIAFGALSALAEHGVRVPDDVSVIGFDDVPAAAHSTPPLTTIRQSVRQVGEQAAKTLLACIDGRVTTGHHALLPYQVIARDTVGTAPTSHTADKVGGKF
jgi:LacI family transcriptional regulator